MSIVNSLRNCRYCRIGGFAIFDIITSMLGTVAIMLAAKHYHFEKLDNINFVIAGICLAIPLGIFIHVIFGVNTRLNYTLGLSNNVST